MSFEIPEMKVLCQARPYSRARSLYAQSLLLPEMVSYHMGFSTWKDHYRTELQMWFQGKVHPDLCQWTGLHYGTTWTTWSVKAIGAIGHHPDTMELEERIG